MARWQLDGDGRHDSNSTARDGTMATALDEQQEHNDDVGMAGGGRDKGFYSIKT